MIFSKHTHCSNCGTQYQELNWPRICHECKAHVFNNPKPVSICVQPVTDDGIRKGLVVAQRAIDPYAGGWALVGGYMEHDDDDVFFAACREFNEETGLTFRPPFSIVFNMNNKHGSVLTFIETKAVMGYDEFLNHTLCKENLRLDIMWDIGMYELCFPSHREVAEKWFRNNQ